MNTDENQAQNPLFVHLVTTFTQSAWISLGKLKNPVTDKLERNLEQASYYIDLLDMLQKKMEGNLSEWETQFLVHSLSELKLNYIEEKNRPEEPEQKEAQDEQPSEEPAKPKSKKKKTKKPPKKQKK